MNSDSNATPAEPQKARQKEHSYFSPDNVESDYTIRQFCKSLSTSRSTTWRLINAGEIDAYHVGKNVRITRASVEAYKERGRILPKSA